MNRQIILEHYYKMSKNFMTPIILDYQVIDNRIVELSTGYDVTDKKIYGVSEFKDIKGKLETTKRGDVFWSYTKAKYYYMKLIKNNIK